MSAPSAIPIVMAFVSILPQIIRIAEPAVRRVHMDKPAPTEPPPAARRASPTVTALVSTSKLTHRTVEPAVMPVVTDKSVRVAPASPLVRLTVALVLETAIVVQATAPMGYAVHSPVNPDQERVRARRAAPFCIAGC